MKLTISPRGLPPRRHLISQPRTTQATGEQDASVRSATPPRGRMSHPMAFVWRRQPPGMRRATPLREAPVAMSNHLHQHTHTHKHSHLTLRLSTHQHMWKEAPSSPDPRPTALQTNQSWGLLLYRTPAGLAPAAQTAPGFLFPARLLRAAQSIDPSKKLPGLCRPTQHQIAETAHTPVLPVLPLLLVSNVAHRPVRSRVSRLPTLANQGAVRAHPFVLSGGRPAHHALRSRQPSIPAPSAPAPSAPIKPAGNTQGPGFHPTSRPDAPSQRPLGPLRAGNANRHPSNVLIHGSPRELPHPAARSPRPPAVVERVWRIQRTAPPSPKTMEPGASRAIDAGESAPTVPDKGMPGPHPLTPSTLRASGQPPFDRSTMERLTDEVARNIEKRLRIERERRGL